MLKYAAKYQSGAYVGYDPSSGYPCEEKEIWDARLYSSIESAYAALGSGKPASIVEVKFTEREIDLNAWEREGYEKELAGLKSKWGQS